MSKRPSRCGLRSLACKRDSGYNAAHFDRAVGYSDLPENFRGPDPMASAKVLLLESERAHATSFAPALVKRGYAVSVDHHMHTDLRRAQAVGPGIVVLDAASLKPSGARLCGQLCARLNGTPVV